MSRVAIIAGTGALPALLADALPGAAVLVAALEGVAADLPGREILRFRIERLVPFLDHLEAEGVTRVVFAGGVTRPRLEPEAFDPRTAQLVPRLLAAIGQGDDDAHHRDGGEPFCQRRREARRAVQQQRAHGEAVSLCA